MTTPKDRVDMGSSEVLGLDVPSTPVTREALYALVWSEPMLKVAARYAVSSSYMGRICTLLNVPRPERGYWAKLVVGKAPQKPALPDAQPGDELVWSRDRDQTKVTRPLPRQPASARRKRHKPVEPRPDHHPLIKGAKLLFESGRLSHNSSYLKPAKKLLVDLTVSKTGLDKALSFANQLFLSFESFGHRVVIAPPSETLRRAEVDEREEPCKKQRYSSLWSPWRCTVVHIGTVAFGLSIIEMSEEVEVRYVNGEYVRESEYVAPKRRRYAVGHTWTTTRDFPTGRLCLQAYSPYLRAKWVHHWRETIDRDLTSRIPAIVKELERAVVDVARLIEEGTWQAELERQQWEVQQAKWRREEAERKAAKALKDSKEELHHIIDQWAESKRLEQFFADAEGRVADLDADERLAMLDKLKSARELIGSSDALKRFQSWKSPEER